MGLLGNLPDIGKLSAMFDEDFAGLTTLLNQILEEIRGLRSDLAARPPTPPGTPTG